jgi:hypothetical protein
MFAALGSLFSSIGSSLAGAAGSVGSAIGGAAGSVGSALGTAGSAIGEVAGSVGSGIANAASTVGNAALSTGGKVFDAVVDTAATVGEKALLGGEKLASMAVDTVKAAPDLVKTAYNATADGVETFADGFSDGFTGKDIVARDTEGDVMFGKTLSRFAGAGARNALLSRLQKHKGGNLIALGMKSYMDENE